MTNARAPIVDVCDPGTNDVPVTTELRCERPMIELTGVEIPDQIGRSRPVKTQMSEQAQLESYPRQNIEPVQYGANLVFDTAGARKQLNQTSCSQQEAKQRAEETLWCPAKEPVAVIQSRQDQCHEPGRAKNPQ